MTKAFFGPGFRVTDDSDNPLAGGTARYYAAGTTTPKAVYSDFAASVSLGAVVNLNSAGLPVSGSNVPVIVYPGTGSYRVRYYDADGVLVPGMDFDAIPGKDEEVEEASTAIPTTPVISKTSSYTITANERGKLINANPTGGSFAITLPSAVSMGDSFRVGVRHTGSANHVSIVSSGSQVVRAHKALRSYSLTGMGETAWFVSDGSDWIVDGYHPRHWKGDGPYFRVLDRLTAPPANPDAGARYIINGTPTGTWSALGFAEHDIAEADGNGSWIRLTPEAGWMAFDADEEVSLVFRHAQWENFQVDPGTSLLRTFVVQDQRSAGTNGGTPTAAAWTTSTLNTSVVNTIDGASLASNTITLPAGTYEVEAFKTFLMTKLTKIRFRSSDSSIIIHGTQAYLGDYDANSDQRTETGGILSLKGRFTIETSTDFVLEYRCNEAPGGSWASQGLGYAHNLTPEVYATVSILDLSSLEGPKGEQGDQGQDGLDAAYAYSWNTGTSGDPGAGYVLANNATPASITQIHISETDAFGATLSDVIASWDNSSSSIKARLKISKEGATQNFLELLISGTGTDQGSYWTFPVTYVSHGGTLALNDALALLVIEKGDKGDTGPAGVIGPTNFIFDTSTTDADPGSGYLRLNHATPASATTVYIDNNNRSSVDVSAWIDTFDDAGASGMRGYLVIMDALSASTVFRIYSVTGSVVDGTGYRKVSVTHLAGGGSFTNGNEILVTFFPRGPSGSGLADVVDDTSPQLGGNLDMNGFQIQAGGVSINPIGKQTLVIPAAAWCPTVTNGAGRSYAELATNKLISETLDFDTTTQEFATFEWIPPKRWNAGTITFRVRWRVTGGSSTQTLDMALSGVAISDDDAEDAAPGTPVVVTDTWIANGDLHISPESTAVTIAGSPAKADKVYLKLQRNVSSDNLSGDALIEAVEIFYTTDAATDA